LLLRDLLWRLVGARLVAQERGAGVWFFNRRKWGMTVLAVWLILMGLFPLAHIDFPQSGVVLAVLGIAAGVLLLLDR
jgi:hypothetical protein